MNSNWTIEEDANISDAPMDSDSSSSDERPPNSGSSKPAPSPNSKLGSRQVKEPKIHACDICGLKFGRKRNVKTHLQTHSEAKNFSCPVCERRFRRIYELRRHVVALHPDSEGQLKDSLVQPAEQQQQQQQSVKAFQCEGCGTGFSRRDALVRHMKRGVCGSAAAIAMDVSEKEEASLGSPRAVSESSLSTFGSEGSRVPLPTIPDLTPPPINSVIPPDRLLAPLLETFNRFIGATHNFIHPPSFRRAVSEGRQLGLLCCVLYATLRFLDPDPPLDLPLQTTDTPLDGWTYSYLLTPSYRAQLERTCDAYISAEYARLLPPAKATSQEIADLLKALVFVRVTALANGQRDLHHRLYRMIHALFPLLEFEAGESMGTEESAETWIRREETSRLCTSIVMVDVGIATNLGERSLCGWEDLRMERGRWRPEWGNVRVACPDTVFEEFDQGASRAVPEHGVGNLGELLAWIDYPVGSERRDEFLKRVVGNVLERGFTASALLQISIWPRMREFNRVFSEKGYLLHENLEMDEGASNMRETLVHAMKDVWANLPPEILELDEAAMGEWMSVLGSQTWGLNKGVRLVHLVIFFHAFSLNLNVPYELLDPGSPSNELDEQTRLKAEAWPSTEAFIAAESHAISISRLVKSILVAGKGKPEVRHLPPMWGLAVIRAAWVHFITIRKLRRTLESNPMPAPELSATLDSIQMLINEVDGAITGLAEFGGVWATARDAIHVVARIVERQGEGDGIVVRLTEEEVAVVKGLRDLA